MSEAPVRRVSALLHEAGADAWAAADQPSDGPRRSRDGTLPHETFRRYFTQNVLYLEDYARAIGIDRGEGARPGRDHHADAVPGADRGERDPREPARSWIGSAAIRRRSRVAARCCRRRTRTRGISCRPARSATAPTGLTAVLPCQWSYGELARPLTAHPPADPIYADWIALFGNDEYDGLVADSTALLDRLVDPDDRATDGGARGDLRTFDAPRSGVLGHGLREPRTAGPPDEGGTP